MKTLTMHFKNGSTTKSYSFDSIITSSLDNSGECKLLEVIQSTEKRIQCLFEYRNMIFTVLAHYRRSPLVFAALGELEIDGNVKCKLT